MRRPAPGSKRWARIATASKVAAIVGASPHDTPLSIWHKMRGDVPWSTGVADPEVLERGHALEPAILSWWRRRHGVKYRELRRQVWITREDLPWAGCTVDGLVRDFREGPMVEHHAGSLTFVGPNYRDVVVEAKTSLKDDEWGEPGTDQVPLDYLTQAYWTMALAPQVAEVRVAVLLSRLGFAEYVVPRDDAVQAELVDDVAAFIASLDDPAGRPPLDDHLATRAVLRALHPDIDRDATAWIPEPIADEWLAADLAAKAADARLVAAQIRVLDLAGRARTIAVHPDRTVGRRQRNGHQGVSLVPIHPRKTKEL